MNYIIKIDDISEEINKNHSIEQTIIYQKNADDMGINRANPFLKNGEKRFSYLKELIKFRSFKISYKPNKTTGAGRIKIYDIHNNQFFFLDFEYFQKGFKETAINHLIRKCKINIIVFSYGKTPNEYYLFSLNQNKTANRTGEDENNFLNP